MRLLRHWSRDGQVSLACAWVPVTHSQVSLACAWVPVTHAAFTGPPSWLYRLHPRFPQQGLEQPPLHHTLYFHVKESVPLTGYTLMLNTTFLLQNYNPCSHGHCSYSRAILFIRRRSSSLAERASASSILAWASFCLRHSFSSMSWNDIWETRGFNHFPKTWPLHVASLVRVHLSWKLLPGAIGKHLLCK